MATEAEKEQAKSLLDRYGKEGLIRVGLSQTQVDELKRRLEDQPAPDTKPPEPDGVEQAEASSVPKVIDAAGDVVFEEAPDEEEIGGVGGVLVAEVQDDAGGPAGDPDAEEHILAAGAVDEGEPEGVAGILQEEADALSGRVDTFAGRQEAISAELASQRARAQALQADVARERVDLDRLGRQLASQRARLNQHAEGLTASASRAQAGLEAAIAAFNERADTQAFDAAESDRLALNRRIEEYNRTWGPDGTAYADHARADNELTQAAQKYQGDVGALNQKIAQANAFTGVFNARREIQATEFTVQRTALAREVAGVNERIAAANALLRDHAPEAPVLRSGDLWDLEPAVTTPEGRQAHIEMAGGLAQALASGVVTQEQAVQAGYSADDIMTARRFNRDTIEIRPGEFIPRDTPQAVQERIRAVGVERYNEAVVAIGAAIAEMEVLQGNPVTSGALVAAAEAGVPQGTLSAAFGPQAAQEAVELLRTHTRIQSGELVARADLDRMNPEQRAELDRLGTEHFNLSTQAAAANIAIQGGLARALSPEHPWLFRGTQQAERSGGELAEVTRQAHIAGYTEEQVAEAAKFAQDYKRLPSGEYVYRAFYTRQAPDWQDVLEEEGVKGFNARMEASSSGVRRYLKASRYPFAGLLGVIRGGQLTAARAPAIRAPHPAVMTAITIATGAAIILGLGPDGEASTIAGRRAPIMQTPTTGPISEARPGFLPGPLQATPVARPGFLPGPLQAAPQAPFLPGPTQLSEEEATGRLAGFIPGPEQATAPLRSGIIPGPTLTPQQAEDFILPLVATVSARTATLDGAFARLPAVPATRAVESQLRDALSRPATPEQRQRLAEIDARIAAIPGASSTQTRAAQRAAKAAARAQALLDAARVAVASTNPAPSTTGSIQGATTTLPDLSTADAIRLLRQEAGKATRAGDPVRATGLKTLADLAAVATSPGTTIRVASATVAAPATATAPVTAPATATASVTAPATAAASVTAPATATAIAPLPAPTLPRTGTRTAGKTASRTLAMTAARTATAVQAKKSKAPILIRDFELEMRKLPAGVYPRVVEFTMGFITQTVDLDTGSRTFRRGGKREPGSPRFTVIATDNTPPTMIRQYGQGVVDILVGPRRVAFRAKKPFRARRGL